MDANREIKWAIAWNRFNLQLVGVWPDPLASDTGIGKYRFLLTVILMITFLTAPQMANLVLIWGDAALMTENLAIANIPVFNAIMKLFFIWYHRNTLRPLLSSFKADWHQVKLTAERSTMLKNAQIARRISIGMNILTQTTLTVYLLLRLAGLIMMNRKQADSMRCSFYLTTYPYDVCKSPMIHVTCLGQILTAYMTTVTYTGVDSFICMLIFHACGQYMNLGATLKKLFDKDSEAKNSKDIRNEFANIVKRHNHLIEFSTTIEGSFNVLLLIQLVGCTIQLCFQGFQIFTSLMQNDDIPTLELIFLALYVSSVAMHIYFYCYIGEMLLVQSSAIGYFAYDCQWYNVHPREARDLLLIMRRTTKPLCLTAGKFSTFCLETFSTILKTSMGYLSVLVAVSANVE